MNPDDPTAGTAGPGPENLADLRLTQTQKEILEALCRPQIDGNRWATPATNQEIASKVYLSVDAVKAHLRVLYRKFGVEPLPHNQKRARLVELVFEGKVLELPATEEPPSTETSLPAAGAPEDSAPADRAAAGPLMPAEPPVPPPDRPARPGLLIAGGVVGVLAVIALLLATGVIGGSDSDSGDEPTPLGEYRTEVNRFCGFAFPFTPPSPRLPIDVRANEYYKALSPVRDRVNELTPPAGEQPALARFTKGLDRATSINNSVVVDPPTSRDAQGDVANLIIASGQVQAGALGFGLGSRCKGIASVIARSADSISRG